MQSQDLLHFWFEDIDQRMWFQKDDQFDEMLTTRYGSWVEAASKGELAHWRSGIQGRLAEIILLDQFSRNMFRDTAKAFANDGMALALSQEAIRTGQVRQLSAIECSFLYMPFMHSESAVIHHQAVSLFSALNLPDTLAYELKHQAIIERFGRYPHRNAALGRESTPEEITFLAQPGSRF